MTASQKGKNGRQKVEGRRQQAICFCLLPSAFCLLSLGCQHCQPVERELRNREREVRELREELERSTALNQAFHQELCQIKQGVVPPQPAVRETPGKTESSKPAAPAEPAAALPLSAGGRGVGGEGVLPPSTIKEVALGWQTGGYHQGRQPGDDALQVVLEPRDHDGSTIKTPGCLRVTALEILPEGLKRPLSSWEIPADHLRRSWKSGLFGSGYYVVLPWKCCPATEKVRVVAQFMQADGRLFEADKDVTIHLPPGAASHAVPALAPTFEEIGPTLPMPHKVEKPQEPLSAAVKLLRPE
jgi:hypothetical protein